MLAVRLTTCMSCAHVSYNIYTIYHYAKAGSTFMHVTPFVDVLNAATTYLSDRDPVMGRIISEIGLSTRIPRYDIFEALIDAIASQQISVQAAHAIMTRLRAAVPDGAITPEALLPLQQDELRAIGFSASKARYIRNLLEHINSGELDLALLPDLDDEAVITTLIKVKGIGRWTAEMILILALNRPDVLPVDDLGLLEGIRVAYQLPERPSRKEALARGELWRPYRTFATWYLWRLRQPQSTKAQGIAPL